MNSADAAGGRLAIMMLIVALTFIAGQSTNGAIILAAATALREIVIHGTPRAHRAIKSLRMTADLMRLVCLRLSIRLGASIICQHAWWLVMLSRR